MRYNIIYILAALTLAFTGCRTDIPDGMPVTGQTVKTGDIVKVPLQLNSGGYATRALNEEQENTWDNVWMAQFRENGSIEPTTIGEYFNSNINMVDIVVGNPNENMTFYFVLNTSVNPFLDSSSQPYATLNDFLASSYEISAQSDIENNNLLVMVGTWTGEIVNESNQMAVRKMEVYARRLTSKIDITVRADKSGIPGVYQFRKIEIQDIQICATPVSMTMGEGSHATLAAQLRDLPAITPTMTSQPTDEILVYQVPTYYLLENMQGNAGPDTATDGEKNTNAESAGIDDVATYLYIWAKVIDGLNDGVVRYKVYLGKNPRNNFDIQRNYHYNVTITISGFDVQVNIDSRVDDTSELHQLQLQRLDGSPDSPRAGEVKTIIAGDAQWGGGLEGNTTTNSANHLKVESGNDTWGFNLTFATSPVLNSYLWPNLQVWYLEEGATSAGDWIQVKEQGDMPPGSPYITYNYPSTASDYETRKYGITGFKGTGFPSGARFKVVTGGNSSPRERTVTMEFTLDNYTLENRRTVTIKQGKTDLVKTPETVYFPAAAGVYAIPVRARHWMEWGFSSTTASSSNLEVVGLVGTDGTYTTNYLSDKIQGNGAVLVRIKTANTVLPNRTIGNLSIKWEAGAEILEASIGTYQLATANDLWATRDNHLTGGIRYAMNYSSDPVHESISALSIAAYWAIDLITEIPGQETSDDTSMNYLKDETLIGATSSTNGKENTLKVFNAIDRYIWNELPAAQVPLPPIVTPAGICMSMNEDFEQITSVDDPRFVWYLPDRYEALMDVTASMLRLDKAGGNLNLSLWSSTTGTTVASTHSAYFAGNSVDVSATHSEKQYTRCIRKKDFSSAPADYKTYPAIESINGYPVVITRDTVDNVPKGFVDMYLAPTLATHYRMGYPYRFARKGYDYTIDANGPMEINQKTLSPKFQVATKDANTGSFWRIAGGWNSSMDDIADPATGCALYREGGYVDWRLPTELELRLIGLLGGSSGANSRITSMKYGGMSFTDFSDFTPLDAYYWTGTQYTDGTRANWVRVAAEIRGSANDKNTTYVARCVRDIGR